MVRTFIFSLIFVVIIPFSLSAQTEKGQIAFSAELGVSLLAGQWENYTAPALIISTPPVYMGQIDYALLDALSIGGAFGYQKVSTLDKNHSYNNTSGITKTEDVTISLTRMNFAYRVLFHYVRTKNLDMYLGVRMGLNYYQYSNNSNDLNYKNGSDHNKYGFAPQIIGIGLRIYVIKDLAINTELGIGYPNFFSFGLTYRM